MATKYKLLDTSEEFTALQSDMETKLGLPDGKGSEKYGSEVLVDNPEHADHGKILFPVLMSGDWKCDQYFSADELVDHDSSWAKPVEELV